MKQFFTKGKVAVLLLLAANMTVFLTIWLKHEYDKISIDQFLFHLKTTSTGVHRALVGSAVLYVGVIPLAIMAAEIGLYLLYVKREKEHRRRIPAHPRLKAFVRRHILPLAAGVLGAAVIVFGAEMNIYAFVRTATEESDFIQEHSVDPAGVTLHFPEKPRNLVYIFLESMESTYADLAAGAPVSDCYIPELRQLAEDNVHFSNTTNLGGALSYPGTTWTAAAMVAQTCGEVVKIDLRADAYGGGEEFLPGATSIGEILAERGYSQVLLLGSDAEFHGREAYFTEHGNYTILDTNALKEAGRLDPDYDKWWGFEDKLLFSFAKEELTRLAEEGKPFNLTMLTADTHFPDGCPCELCGSDYEDPYANVLACSSRQVAEFVEWIQAQPFYENTTIVISGDHLTMDAAFMDDIDETYTRTVYNCFIHPAAEPARTENRSFGTFDMFPSTLAALGVEIEGDRMALGTNLFSDTETLTEQYGYEYLFTELQKQSDYYDATLLQMEDENSFGMPGQEEGPAQIHSSTSLTKRRPELRFLGRE